MMKQITLKLTVDELRMLITLASDQLFRKEFIDPKMPGFHSDGEGLKIEKALIARLRLVSDDGAVRKSVALSKANGAPS